MAVLQNLEQLTNVPEEMRAHNQWVVWKYEQRENSKLTKVPYCVITGHRASVSDPATWCTFDQAVARLRAANCPYSGLGFVFTKSDPFTGIDLDVRESEDSKPSNAQQFTFIKLGSYAEKSPSGRGAHIIVKDVIPHGRNDQTLGIELYDAGRFFTVTGDRLNDNGIEDRTKEVLELWHEIGGVFDDNNGEPHEVKNPATLDDETLVSRICASHRNKSYFEWTGAYNWSQSYRSVLGSACLFSSDEEQVKRVILASPMVTKAPPHGKETRPRRVARLWAKEYGYACRQGDHERGDRAYRIWSTQWFKGGSRELHAKVMQQAHDNVQAMLVNNNARVMETAKIAAKAAHKATIDPKGDALPVPFKAAGLLVDGDLDITAPPGVFSDLVNEVCARTRNPSEIMAIWSILGFVSGAVGRAYVTEEGAGVNNFFILSAGSNTGKTQHWSALISIVRTIAPKLLTNVFGGDVSSAQIIAKEGQKNTSMVLRLPDAGPWLKGIIEAKTQLQLLMRSALLNIYESAGEGSEWHIPKSIRAKDDGNETIDEFNMSIVLDTTPQYVTDFDLSDFTDGLMSRFIMVYGPKLISPLQQPKRTFDLPKNITIMFDDLCKLYIGCSRPTNVGSMAGAVGIPARIVVRHEAGLAEYMWSLELEMTDIIRDIQMNKLPPHYIATSRVVLNAKRVAACIAMIECPRTPIITYPIFNWALRFVLLSVTSVVRMFDAGAMGSQESKQEAAIIDFMDREIRKHPDRPYVTLRQIGQSLDRLSCFAKAKMGARYTRQRVIADMTERGVIIKTTVQGRTKPMTVITFASQESET